MTAATVPSNQRSTHSLSYSLLLHLGFFALLLLISYGRHNYENLFAPQSKTVILELNPPSHREQIVRTDVGQEVKEAAPDAFLGEKNRVVTEQKVSRQEALQPATPSQPTPAQKQGQGQKTDAKALPLSRLGVAMLPAKQEAGSRPEWVDYSQQFGKTASAEYVKGLKESETTALNTKEFVFFGYYERIRKQLDQAWRPILYRHLIDRMRTGRQLASNKDHITRTLVVLDKGGDVVRVQVLEASGTRELDKAAIDAFNQAGPFPNPPTGLVSERGEVEVRWDFVIRS